MSVFAYIAHKGNAMFGACAPAAMTNKEVTNFISRYIKKGCDIKQVNSREEYLAVYEKMINLGAMVDAHGEFGRTK